MSGNPYIAAQRTKYDALRETIAGYQTRAAEEKRDLTEDELTSIKEQGEQARAIAAEIESLTEIENRNRKVAELGASLLTEEHNEPEKLGQARTSSTTTRDRDPGHYRREAEGGQHSFFADLYRSRSGDTDASTRITEHTRAEHARAGLTTGGNGVGVVPPRWMTDEFEEMARQGRYLANAVRNVPLGDDPRPLTLPKQTAGTEDAVTWQSAENDGLADKNTWDSDTDVVSPKPLAGKQLVSRQLIDMSTPAVDQLIYADLMSVYNLKVEKKVGSVVVAAAGDAITTLATDEAFGTNAAAIDAVVDTAIAVRNARKLPANLAVMTVNRWGKFKKLKDAQNRPLLPVSTYGPQNVNGIGSVNADGVVEDLPVIATDGVGDGSTYPESVLVMRSTDTILFESNMLRFRFEEQAGPESIVLGIWGYVAAIVRQSGNSVKRFDITIDKAAG